MQKSKVLFIVVLVASFLGVFAVITERANTQEKPLQDRVANLEMQISDLQVRIMRIEKQSSQSVSQPNHAVQNVPQDKVAWRSLEKGMNKSQVRRILGEPKSITEYGSFADWKYGDEFSTAYVRFNNSGLVDGWSEP